MAHIDNLRADIARLQAKLKGRDDTDEMAADDDDFDEDYEEAEERAEARAKALGFR